MRKQMTISGPAPRYLRMRSAPRRGLVIILAGLLTLQARIALGAEDDRLTTLASTRAVPALASVVIQGSTVYAAPQLFAAYRDQLGQPISRDGALAITTELAARYVRDGYLRPEFRFDDSLTGRGVLRVQVFEAQVSNVVLEGDAGNYRNAIERIGAGLAAARPLRRDDVPRALQAMRQIAGLSVNASTRRDTNTPNAFELIVQTNFSPVEGTVRMNNRGTDQVGPNFLLGQVFANGLFGRQEKIGLIFAAATDHDEYLGGGLYVDTPLGSAGTRASAFVFRSRSAPNEAPVNLDDEYFRQRASVRVSRPLRRDPGSSLTASIALEADDLTIENGGTRLRADNLRVLETALRNSGRAGVVQYSFNLQLRKGLNALGSGLEAPDLLDDPRRTNFLVTLLQASVYRALGERWSLRFDAFAQSSADVLPDSERFKIGGDRLGRGFEVAEIAGDSGLGGKLELRRALLNTESFAGRVSTYGFYDIGAAWKRDLPGRQSAATAGLGLSMGGGSVSGYLEVAAPLTGSDIEGKRNTSVFAELSYRF